jgi:hypothetical protein
MPRRAGGGASRGNRGRSLSLAAETIAWEDEMANQSQGSSRRPNGHGKREGYHVADLTPEEIARLRALEETLSREHGDEVILVAYAPDRAK